MCVLCTIGTQRTHFLLGAATTNPTQLFEQVWLPREAVWREMGGLDEEEGEHKGGA